MKTVYTTSTLSDAELFRVRLRNHGIESTIEGDNSPLRGPATPFAVVVRDEDADGAEKVLREAFPAEGARKRRPRKAAPTKKKAAGGRARKPSRRR